jgi:DnaJ-class molecular chaperone
MIEITIDTEDGGQEELRLPSVRIVCPTCNGGGTQDIFSNGVPNRYFDEDPDFAEDYRSGMYDKTCEECHGRNVVDEVDRSQVDAETLAKLDWHEEQKAMYEAEVAAEQRYFSSYGSHLEY